MEDDHDPPKTYARKFFINGRAVDVRAGTIECSGGPQRLEPRIMSLLVALVADKGEVITRNELIDTVWSGAAGADQSLNQAVSRLRSVLGDSPFEREFIETVPKRGYRLIADIALLEPHKSVEDAQAAEEKTDSEKRQTAAVRHDGTSRPEQSIDRRRLLAVAAVLVGVILAVIYQLARTTGPAEGPDPLVFTRAIAVLPFTDLSPGGDQAYFTEGITEELLNTLAGVEGLQVAARISSTYFGGREPGVREIGQVLGVAHILEGSVRRDGNRIRITAQLIDADSGFHLWSQTYDRELGDIFTIQYEMSVAIVDALRDKLELNRTEIGEPRAARAASSEAYTEYLLGRHLMNQRSPEALKAVIRHFERAIEIDESYAPPYANMAITYGLLTYYEGSPKDEAYELAEPFAERAMELDPGLAEAHAAMYFMQSLKNIRDPNFKHLDRAIALNPSYMNARNWKINELTRWRRLEEAMALREASLKLDPLSPVHNFHLVQNLLETGRRDEAKAVAERMKSFDFSWGQRFTGDIAYARGDVPAAIEAYLIGLKSVPQQGPLTLRLAVVLSELGFGAEAERLYPHSRTAHSSSRNRGNWILARKFAREGLESGRDNSYFIPEIDAARLLVYQAARLCADGERFGKEASMAKLFSSEVAMRVTDEAIQIHGGYGYTSEFPVERHHRDAKLCTIGEGTSEIQRLVIARYILQNVG